MVTQQPAEPQKLYGLDHLRALAIVMVFGFHYQRHGVGHPAWLEQVAAFGWTGVDLFFVLSGFLISSQLFAQLKKGKSISLKTFFVKRFFRIIPVYLFVVGIYFCFPFFREKEALSPLWKFLTFTQNFGLNQKFFGTFSHAWSLCVEEHFYLLLPVTLIGLQSIGWFKKASWLLITLFLLGFAVRWYNWNAVYLPKIDDVNVVYWLQYIYYPTYNRLDGLLVGVSIAAVYQYLPTVWKRIAALGNYLVIIGLLVLTTAYFFCSELADYSTTLFGFTAISIGYGFLVAGAISPSSFLYQWHSKSTTFIATVSYALYLSHKGIVHMVQELLSNWGIDRDGNLMMLICFSCSVVGALLLRVAVEKPFMKWRDHFLKQKTNPAPGQAAVVEPTTTVTVLSPNTNLP